MVTQISLGSFGTLNGRRVLTGGISQIDTEGLIKALTEARREPAVRLETANKTLDKKSEAYNDLKTVFTKLKSAADTLRNPPGIDVATQNIFEYRKASLTGTGGVVASSYVDVTVEPGAAAQNYTINSITQLAQQTKQQSGVMALADATTASAVTANGSPVAGLLRAGTINLRAVDGTVGGIPITFNQGDSLTVVAAKFNEVSSRTGIQATILNISPGNYKLIFSATQSGTTYGFDLGVTSPTSGFGVASDPSSVFSMLSFGTTQTAQDAIFSIDGVSITRASNAVADVIEGVTFTLKDAPMPAGTVEVAIKPDTELVVNAITAFADAYNEFRLFVSKQSELDDEGVLKETAVLGNQSTFRRFVNDISAEVSRIINGITSGDPSQLSDIGLDLENFDGDDENLATKNIIVVDTDKLNSVLLSDFQSVRTLFEYRQSSDNSNFQTFKRSNSLEGVSSFSVSINRGTSTYQVTYTDPDTLGLVTVDLDGTDLTGGGVSLAGQDGTVFEGMEFIYGVAGDTTVNVTVTQGFGDRFYNMLDGYLNDTDGVLLAEIDQLATDKTRNEEQITTIDERITAYRERLVAQYAALEAALSRANQLLQLLDAQVNAQSNQ